MEIIRCQSDNICKIGSPVGFPKVGVPVRHVKTNVLGEGIRNAAANVPSKVCLVYRTFGGQTVTYDTAICLSVIHRESNASADKWRKL